MQASRRDLPIAVLASAVCHGIVALTLTLWLMPGQRSALLLRDAPLVVVLGQATTVPADAARPTSIEAAPATAAPATLLTPSPVPSAQASVTAAASPEPATSTALAQPRPVDAAVVAPRSASSAPPAIASGTTTLDVDHAASASVALDALAARASSDDFPAEVGRPVRIRHAPTVSYPRSALEREARGSVLALVIVDAQGMPEDISLLEFEQEFVVSAEAALRETRFDPAEDMNGAPIRFYTLVRINFLGSAPGSATVPR